MKYRQLMAIVGLTVGAMCFTGCTTTKNADTTTESSENEESSDSDSETQESVTGTVTEITDDTITLEVNGDDGTTETKEIALTDDTVYEKSGGGPGENGGQPPQGDGTGQDGNDEAPEKPDGDASDGQAPGNGDSNQPPEKPEGDSSDNSDSTDKQSNDDTSSDTNSQPPAKPEGESDSNSKDTANANGNNTDSNSSDSESTDGDSTDSENADSSKPDGQPPEKPEGDGQASDGNGSAPEQSTETITKEDIQVGDQVTITFDADGNAATVTVSSEDMGGGPGGMGGQQGVDSYDAATTYTEDTEVSDQEFTSDGTDENAILVQDGATVKLNKVTINRNSDDSTGGDNSSFYGVGASLLTTDGTTYINDSTIESDAAGGAGLFAYGDGTIYAADTTITTKQDTSGGVHVAGGGTLYGWNLTAETNGTSSAAVRSDRGGGTMVLDGGSYTSNGADSPAVYCTADIAIHDADLTANGAEAVCIEGLNTLRLYDCNLTGSMTEDERNDCIWNVILYQSMSGDSEVGNSTFEMNGGTLSAKEGGLFYTTNTESTITLNHVDIQQDGDSDFFLKCTGNNNQRGWGTAGANGADCLFTAIDQEMNGDILWDSISNLNAYLTEGTVWTGSVQDDESSVTTTGDGTCNLTIDEGSTWIVTGDSTLTSLSNAGTIKDADGNTVTVKGSDGTVYVKGTSDYTITVDSYQDSTDTSGCSTTTSWSDYEVENPFA